MVVQYIAEPVYHMYYTTQLLNIDYFSLGDKLGQRGRRTTYNRAGT